MEKYTKQEVFSLSMDAYHKRSTNEKYSAQEREDGFVEYLKDLSKDFRRNKLEIFEIVEETVNEILPKRVLEAVRNYAEFKTFPQNTTVKFRIKNGKIKAVAVALGGHVKRQRVDKGEFTMETEAIQAKVYEEYERIISGQVDWNEMINLVAQAIEEAILVKIHQALVDIYSKLPNANKASSPALVKADFDAVVNVVKAYGQPVIMGTSVALAQLPLDTYASEADKADMRNKGYLGVYRGCSVVELPNSFEDTENTIKTFSDKYVFIIPAGNEKIVKVALEGGLHTDDHKGADWSYNFETYQKVGVGVQAVNHIGMYEITDLA